MSGVDTRIGARQEATDSPFQPTTGVPQSSVQDAIVAVQASLASTQASLAALQVSAADDQIALKAAVFN